MTSQELFPTSVSNTITSNENSLNNSNSSQRIVQQNKQKQIQIARPHSKLSSNNKQQKAPLAPRRTATALDQRKKTKNYSPPSSTRIPTSPQSNSNAGSSQISRQNPSLYTPPQISSVRSNQKVKISQRTYEAIHNPNSLPFNIDELKKIIYQLLILQQRHIDSSEYPEAQHIQRVIRIAENKLKNEENRKSNETDVQNTLVKRQELQAIVDKFVEDWNKHYDFFVSTTKKEANTLRKQHQEEIELFDSSEPQDLLPKYRKPSTALIGMRQKERALALNHQFLAAEKIKNKADIVEGEETKHQFKVQQSDFLKKRDQLLAKQNEQLRVFVTHAEATRFKMIQQRDTLLSGYLKRLEKIDNEIKNMKDIGKLTDYDMTNAQMSENREKKVTEEEYSYPIPRIRPGTSFLNARNGFQTVRNPSRKNSKKSTDSQYSTITNIDFDYDDNISNELTFEKTINDDFVDASNELLTNDQSFVTD